MRVRIEVHGALGKFILPQGYSPYVQGLINACIPENITWSGEAGAQDAHFKLFTFSQLYARSVERIDIASRENQSGESHFQYQLAFSSPVWFYLSSPSREFVEALSQRLEQARDLHLERNAVESVHASAARVPDLSRHGQVTWHVRTISPMTVYQSENRDSNSAKYLAPSDPLFARTVLDNAMRKYYAWAQEKAPVQGFSIKCLDRTPHLAVVNFKDTPVRGYTGRFLLTGDIRLLSFLYESGLGGKNSHGFGMFDIIPSGEDAHWEREKSRSRAGETASASEVRPGNRQAGNGAVVRVGRHGDGTGRSGTKISKQEHDDHSWSSRSPMENRPEQGESRHWAGRRSRQPTLPRDGSHGRKGSRSSEEPHRKFVSRYAPEIKPVSHAKAATGSYSIWDGKAKTELPRFVRPDGTQSTGGPQMREHRPGLNQSGKDHPQGGAGKVDHERTSSGAHMRTHYDMPKRQHGPRDQRGNRGR